MQRTQKDNRANDTGQRVDNGKEELLVIALREPCAAEEECHNDNALRNSQEVCLKPCVPESGDDEVGERAETARWKSVGELGNISS